MQKRSTAKHSNKSALLFFLLAIWALLLPERAEAHSFIYHLGEQGSGFIAAFLHPFTGLDHLLAAIVVGLLATVRSGRARLKYPFAFTSSLSAGALLGAANLFTSPELAIALTVFILGLLLCQSKTSKETFELFVLAIAGLIHGAAHGAEVQGHHAGAIIFGLVVGTALLHLIGILVATRLQLAQFQLRARAAGIGFAVAGAVLVLQVF